MQQEKIKKLVGETKKILDQKGRVIVALQNRIIELKGEVPEYRVSLRATDESGNKLNQLIQSCKRQIENKDAYIRELSMYRDNLEKKIKVDVLFPESINVANLKDIPPAPAIQKVEVKNYPKIQDVRILNTARVQKVEVVNSPSYEQTEKASSWVPAVITASVKGLSDLAVKLWSRGLVVKIDDEDRLKPQAVIVVDVRGRPVNFATLGGGIFMPGSTSSGGLRPATSMSSGRKTVATPGTAVQLSATGTICRKVTVTAPSSNGGAVYIGGSTVSASSGSEQGLLLNPTGSVELDIDDVGKVWIDAEVSGNGVTFTYVR